jgi:tungstate transport system ATP-binding protein
MTPLLVVENFRKQYGSRSLFNIPRLELARGTSYVLTGDNGTGKTTLLKALAGLESAEFGAMRYLDRNVSGDVLTELKRDVIYVHQHPYLFDTSVAANIAYGLKLRGLDAKEIDQRVEAAIDWAKLREFSNTPPQRLSGGEKQRVALARAWVLKAPVMLFDEPTANLDHASRERVIELLDRAVGENNCVVVACHDHEIINLPHVQRLHLHQGVIQAQP